MKLFRRRRTCTHPEVSLTPSQDAQTALVACARCPWRVVAPMPPTRRVPAAMESGTAVMVDTHAFEQLRLGAQVETIFTDWDLR